MKKLNKAAALMIIFIIVLGNMTVLTPGNDAGRLVEEFSENFDTDSGIYTETFASGRQFTSTVPEGGKTYDGVILTVPKDINATLACDGTTVNFISGQVIYGKGYYVLTAVSSDVISGETVYGYFTFRIMGEPVAGVYNKEYGAQMISCINSAESDGATGLYKYAFPNFKAFYSSVSAYGEEVSQANFILPKNIGYSLKRNGSAISYNNNEIIKTPGSYIMSVYAKNYGVKDEYARVYKTDFNFTITGDSASSDVYETFQAGIADVQSSISGITSGETDTIEEVIETTTENVISDSLSESYNAEANLYKETFSDGEGFYTNIANNGISGGNIYIDIPSNMTVTMTKDGIETQFINKEYLNEQGTYILNITSSSEGAKYRAKFTFRIQKGIEASSDAEPEDTAQEVENIEVIDEDFLYEAMDARSVVNRFDEDRNLFVFNVGESKFYANMPAGMFSSSSLKLTMDEDLDYSVTRDDEDYEITDFLIEETGSYTLFVSDRYGNSLEANFYLYANPVNNFDSFTAPGGYSITGLEYSDYKENYGFDPNADEVKFPEEEAEPEAAEGEENGENADETEAAEPQEEVIDPAREAAEEGAAMINLQVKKASNSGLDVLVMPLDGRYTIYLSGEDGLPPLQTEIVVDKTAPEVYFDGLKSNMKSTGNEVSLVCYDDETTLHLFSKKGDEKILGESGGSATISGVGEYTLIAVDKAGNQSEYTFKITRHIGAAGVGAILLFIAIIIGVVLFMLYNSKKFSVR